MKYLIVPLFCASLGLGLAPAAAATFEERVVVQLRALGYTDITVTFTLLGRAQIIAIGKTDSREIVLNPRTGEILRDFAQTHGDAIEEPVAVMVVPIVLGPEEPVVAVDLAAEVPDPALEVEPEADAAASTFVGPDGLDHDTGTPPVSVIPDMSLAPVPTDSSAPDSTATDSTSPTDADPTAETTDFSISP